MTHPTTTTTHLPEAGRMSLLRSIRAVAWSLIGLRKGSEYRQDLQQVHPLHVIAVGLVAIFAFVGLLMAVVQWAV